VAPPQRDHSEQQTISKPPPLRDVPTPTFTLSSLVDEGAKIAASHGHIPAETDVLELLERCHDYANFIVFGQREVPQNVDDAIQYEEDTATSSLLDLDEASAGTSVNDTQLGMPVSSREKAADTISLLIYDVLRAKNVFITPPMLDLFVRTECLLGSPQYIPSIFYLYANKPIPKPKTSPIVYRNPWPRSPKNAIPRTLSDAALDAAIAKKDLPLAIAIIDTTVALPAFKINKLLRRASFPFLGAALTPIVAWSFAEKVAAWQVAWDPPMAKFVVMSSTMAYIGTLGVVGFVALMTYNDHFERVVWQPGMNLRDRWIREEERLYFDRVAVAWGFKEKWKRGEEQGEEWEALREFVGMRSMILDKTDLLEGMQ
jgi:hypothetical protein